MDPLLLRLLMFLAALTVSVAAILLLYAWIQTLRSAFEDFRRAAYVAALGDIATRSAYPSQIVRGWARDAAFRETLVEYLTFLTGHERDNVLKAAQELEIVEHYSAALVNSRRRRLRSTAAEALGDLADPSSVGVLLIGLTDRVPEVRVQAAHALAAIADPLTVVPLLDAVRAERQPWVADRLADALVVFGRVAVLDATLRLEDVDVQRTTAPAWARLVTQSLTLIGDARAEPGLIRVAGSSDPRLRALAVEGLGRAASPGVVGMLIEFLDDPSPDVRAGAANALSRHLATESIEALVEALGDEARIVRDAAAKAVGALPEGVGALVGVLSTADAVARDAAEDHILASGLFRKALVRLRTGDADDEDHLLIDSLLASGKLEGVASHELDGVGS